MTEDTLKLLALVFVGVVGYFWGQRGQQARLRANLLKSLKEDKNAEEKTTREVNDSSLSDLILKANDRLRKHRSPGEDE